MDFLGTTVRQRTMSITSVLAGLVAAVAAAFGAWQLAGCILALLVTAMLLVQLEVRRRVADLMRQSRQSRETQARMERRLPQGGDDAVERLVTMAEATRKLVKKQPQEFEALLQLYSWVKPQDAMPGSGVWSLNPRGLLNLYAVVQRHRPTTVVELGSGTSTVWLGYALAAHGGSARLVSLDHDAQFADRTRETVQLHQSAMAPTDVRHAPLTEIEVAGEKYRWYRPDELADVEQIDLLVVDGPPSRTGRLARYPAVPMLLDRLAPGARVIVDDASRGDEKEIVRRWMAEVPGLHREPSAVERQLVLRVPGADEPAAAASTDLADETEHSEETGEAGDTDWVDEADTVVRHG